jgi:hypothetical protein
MKIGLFGYPGDHLDRVKTMCEALRRAGAEKQVCLGGIVWSGRKGDDDEDPPATVLRWLRTKEIPTLSNDTDRQIAGWRLQAIENTTGYIKPRVRKFLSAITREEAQWLYSRPSSMPLGEILCCSDNLTIDALFPVPLSKFNANKLFAVMEQKAAFFPSGNGPCLVVRKEVDGVIEGRRFDDMEIQLDSPKVAVILGGIVGYPPINVDASWGAVVDTKSGRVTLICLDAKTHKNTPEQGALLIQRSTPLWRE